MEELVFVIGVFKSYIAIPIIGPPAMSLNVSSFRPPQASNRLETGVPMGHSRFLGSTTPEPETVRGLLLDEIARVRAAGVDREVFTLCKNEKYGQLIENLENVEDSASQMADFALSGQTVAQQITMLAGLTAEDADAALQKILSEERMAVMYIQPDGTAGEELDDEEEMEE